MKKAAICGFFVFGGRSNRLTLYARHDITCLMTDDYDCYQNALAAPVNGILKEELLFRRPRNLEEARKMVSESIRTYSEKRPHLGLKYKTPDEVHGVFRKV